MHKSLLIRCCPSQVIVIKSVCHLGEEILYNVSQFVRRTPVSSWWWASRARITAVWPEPDRKYSTEHIRLSFRLTCRELGDVHCVYHFRSESLLSPLAGKFSKSNPEHQNYLLSYYIIFFLLLFYFFEPPTVIDKRRPPQNWAHRVDQSPPRYKLVSKITTLKMVSFFKFIKWKVGRPLLAAVPTSRKRNPVATRPPSARIFLKSVTTQSKRWS